MYSTNAVFFPYNYLVTLLSSLLLQSPSSHPPTLAMVRGFSHTLRSGGTDGAWQPLRKLAGFQGGWTPLVSGFTPFIWLWHQHTQLHCLGECGRRGQWVGAAGGLLDWLQQELWVSLVLQRCHLSISSCSKSLPSSCSPPSIYLFGDPTYCGLSLQINDIKAHVLSHLPKCLQLTRARPHPSPGTICSPTAIRKVCLSVCLLSDLSLWFACPYIGMMLSRHLSHDFHVAGGALQAGPGPKDSQSPHGRSQICKKAFTTWGAGVVRAVMRVA